MRVRILGRPKWSPNYLSQFISQVAVGKREYLNVFGDDYPTHDGTGVRDLHTCNGFSRGA